jgi:hypothetical protein
VTWEVADYLTMVMMALSAALDSMGLAGLVVENASIVQNFQSLVED